MYNKLMSLERQISSLEGGSLEIRVSSTSNIFNEIKNFSGFIDARFLDF